MKILYVSCHSVLEYDELRMFDDLGIEIFSLGTYLNPNEDWHAKSRPKIKLNNWNHANYESYIKYFDHNKNPDCRLNISKEFIDMFDVIYFQGWTEPITINWENIKHKPIIWRTIGQSSNHTENLMKPYINNGNIKIIRYSPFERKIPNYCGEDILIRFSKRSSEWKNWIGEIKTPATVAQTFKIREMASCYSFFIETSKILACNLYGIGNENTEYYVERPKDLETLYDIYRKHAVYYSFGTKPASYTLNFIEAWMTGIPLISVGSQNGNFPNVEQLYEVPFLIENGISGFISDDPIEFASIAKQLINDDKLSKSISDCGRISAIKLFDESNNLPLWKEFFKLI
jgi:hypothetical protein